MTTHRKSNASPLTRKRISVLSLFVSVIVIAFFSQLGSYLYDKYAGMINSDTSLDNSAFLAQFKKANSQRLPMRIDASTVLLSVETSHNEMLFIFRLDIVAREEMNDEYINTFKQMAEAQLKSSACSAELSTIRARNINIVYLYKGALGKEIARFVFSKEKCNDYKPKS